MPFNFVQATAVLPDPNGCAAISLADPTGNVNYPEVFVEASASDGGSVIDLTVARNLITACPVGVGVATVTLSATENGVPVTGTANVTVTTVNGKLSAAWGALTGIYSPSNNGVYSSIYSGSY